MSNLAAARVSIQAELLHAKKGLEEHVARIDRLEKTLAQIDAIEGVTPETKKLETKTATPAAKANNQVKVKTGKSIEAAKKAKPAKVAKNAKGKIVEEKELPFTGGDYWPNLITEAPQSSSEILASAVGKLGFTATKEQTQKLAGRMTFALNALVKEGKVKDSGKGRDRRFFKA